MDIKEKIEEIVKKITSDDKIRESFKKEPVAIVEKLIEVDLPEDQINQVVSAVKAKIGADKIGGVIGSIFGKKNNG